MLVAPAFYLNYPNEYGRVLGYLKSLGVKNFYSVSFGADIATWGYINYIAKNNAEGLVTQPCPSIVLHIEKHLPELLPNLIPVQSPLMCTAIYLKQYLGIEEELVFLSPCIAKKIEIESKRGLGLIRYNVTFKNLMEHVQRNAAGDFPDASDEIKYGMGAILSKPGGLSDNLEYYLGPDAKLIQIEGEKRAYEYLGSFVERAASSARAGNKKELPMLAEIINCNRGCNFGTGTEIRRTDDDEVAFRVISLRNEKYKELRDAEHKVLLEPAARLARLNERFKDLRLNDFMCEYSSEQKIDDVTVSDAEIAQIFNEKLLKFTDDDRHVDCSACGYASCRDMATAIAYGINIHDNCVYYVKNALAKSHETTQQRMKAMLDASPMLCAIFDENYKVIEANHAAALFFDVPDKQAYIDDPLTFCPEYQPDGIPSKDKIPMAVQACFDNGSALFEWMHQTLDGAMLPCEVHLKRVELGDRNVAMCYVRDLREQKEMLAKIEESYIQEQIANQAKARLEIAEESNRAKSTFLARMSHEIRTPITALLGITDIQLQNPALSHDLEEAFAKIHASSDLLLSIVNDILDLSKIESGKMELLSEKYDIASMINDVVYLHLPTFENKNLEFKLHVDENLPAALIGDSTRIRQIINNLLSNAFKYTIAGSVTLSLDWAHDALLINIQDTGLGMSTEQLDALYKFNEYTRFHESKHPLISGTGLGMPIVYNLTKLMDADISIESELGKGTGVTIRIPQEVSGKRILGTREARKLEKFEIAASTTVKNFSFVPEPMPYGKVLVVDDVDANLYVTRGLLEFYDISIETCGSGSEAVEKVRQGKVYDIIFMDHMMPDMDGTETMHTLRDMGYSKPIIALTADALIGRAEEFIKDGFDGFISKPIHVQRLNAALVKHIKNKKTDRVIADTKTSPAKRKGIDEFQTSVETQQALRTRFAVQNKNVFSDISQALQIGDIKTAHRLAHNLKSTAKLIGETTLSQLALEAESLLKDGQIPTDEQFELLEHETALVLRNIDNQDESHVQTKVLSPEESKALLNKLEPLLEAHNTQCMGLLDSLHELPKTPESERLINQIKDFDFAEAFNTLGRLREVL